MPFVEFKVPRSKPNIYTGDKVRLYFHEFQGQMAAVFTIGRDVINQLGYKHKDKIRLFIDNENPKTWWLVKHEIYLLNSIAGQSTEKISATKNKQQPPGWQLSNIYYNKSTTTELYEIRIVWKDEMPEGFRKREKYYLDWKIHQGGLIFTLPNGNNTAYTEQF